METRRCKYCGQELPIDSFRRYYNRPTGRYTMCLSCEQIANKYKHLKQVLKKNGKLTSRQQEALDKIEKLYAYREAEGLAVPGRIANYTVNDAVDELLARYDDSNG